LPIGKISIFLPWQLLSVNKEQLSDVLKHFPDISSEEADMVRSLKEKFPFSQVLHVLAARAGHNHQWQDQQSLLQQAAVYSTDRTVLKDVMTSSQRSRTVSSHASTTQESTPVVTTHEAPRHAAAYSGDVAEETIHDLKKLSHLKHAFEAMVQEFESGFTPAPEEKPKRSPGRPRKKKDETSDPLIEEIRTSKKQIDPANEKTREQIQIIDQFIKAQPGIIAPKTKPEPAESPDLAVKSGDFGDNIISETLVDILVAQGKKDKAIEVLKKLIWKFPQKKAYFAGRIEDLKK
jgi:hypothetical protein